MVDLDYITIIGAVLVIVEVVGFLFAIDVVMRPRSSQGAIAWLIALIAMPIITVPFYIFLAVPVSMVMRKQYGRKNLVLVSNGPSGTPV